jgi:hypothetical protein
MEPNSADQHCVPKGVQVKVQRCKLKKARHSKQQLLIAAELSRLHKTNKSFDFDNGMSVILTYRFVRQK